MATYTTRSMDTWDIISKRLFGSELYMARLIEANLQYKNVFRFEDGVVLEVPEVDTQSSDYEANLPPWKRSK